MMGSPSEPTEILRIVSSYKSEFRPSTSASALASYGSDRPGKRSLATRLAFDDSMNETVVTSSKQPRLAPDPFDTLAGRRRFASENTSGLQKENAESQARIRELEAQLAGAIARAATADTRAKQVELELATERVEWDRQLQNVTRRYKTEKERGDELNQKLSQQSRREASRDEEEGGQRRRSLDRTAELEARVVAHKKAKLKLDERVNRLEQELANRPDIDKTAYRSQVHGLQSQVRQLSSQLEEKEARLASLTARLDRAGQDRADLATTKEELCRATSTVERLKAELEANRDAVLQRKAMQEKLAAFSELQETNTLLRRRNELLLETQENTALLKEQIANLTADRERAERRGRDRDTLQAQLEAARQELKEWSELMLGLGTVGEVERDTSSSSRWGVARARGVVAAHQATHLQLTQQCAQLKAEVEDLQRRSSQLAGEAEQRSGELARVREEQAGQARLVKMLQRKLQLVTRERDSFKGILDSYEKELTVSGSQMDTDKVAALESNLEAFRSMVEGLEAENEALAARLRTAAGGSSDQPAAPSASSAANSWQLKYEEARARVERLELEVEQMVLRGGHNPLDTKVIHFKQNPMQLALERQEKQQGEIQQENEALKARIKLLEEGQTQDLTIMVGQKLEEGASSQEVIELRENLRKAEVKTQRVMEVFKTSSREFREVVGQLTGYRIDGLADRKYMVKPLLAQSPGDYLLFQRTEQGVLEMLESEFSLELSELMELHLEQHNSIPMFLAGLIIDLFSRSYDTGLEESTPVERYAIRQEAAGGGAEETQEQAGANDDILTVDD